MKRILFIIFNLFLLFVNISVYVVFPEIFESFFLNEILNGDFLTIFINLGIVFLIIGPFFYLNATILNVYLYKNAPNEIDLNNLEKQLVLEDEISERMISGWSICNYIYLFGNVIIFIITIMLVFAFIYIVGLTFFNTEEVMIFLIIIVLCLFPIIMIYDAFQNIKSLK
ncbi:MAG: hypothetical protein ACPGR5_05925 [Chitinophagales bacterium]